MPIVVFLIALLMFVLSGGAQAREIQFDVAPAFGSDLISGRWVPVRLRMYNPTDRDFDAVVEIPVEQPAVQFVQQYPFRIPAHCDCTLTGSGVFSVPDNVVRSAPLSMAVLRDGGGAEIQRMAVLGRSARVGGGRQSASEMLLFVSDRTDETSLDAYGSARFVAMLNISSSIALGSWSADRSELPSSSAGYDAVRAVVLESVELGSTFAAPGPGVAGISSFRRNRGPAQSAGHGRSPCQPAGGISAGAGHLAAIV